MPADQKYFPRPNQDEINDFVQAAYDGKTSSVEEYLDRFGKNIIDAKNRANDFTALHWATRQGFLPCMETLLRRGADPHSENGEHKVSPLIHAAYSGDKYLDALRVLLEHGADYTTLNVDDVARNGNAKIVAFLKEWPKELKRRQALERETWMRETNCRNGLDKPVRAPRLINISKAAP